MIDRDSVSSPSSKKSWIWIAVGVTVAFFGVFALPWVVPFPGPVTGESYSYGFYNPVAVLSLYVAFIPVLIGWLGSKIKPAALSWFVSAPVIFPPWQKAAREYIVLAGATVTSVALVLLWNSYLLAPYWGESSYFLNNIDLVRLGYRPYTDFTFMYGPALLYCPIALDRISGDSLGIENAYAACIALSNAVGFFLFYILQRFLNLADRDRSWILALTLLIWFVVTMGLQYTPLRFAVTPCLLALGNHPRLYRTPGIFAVARLVILITFLTTACFLVSPEMGIACSIGFAASAVIHLWSRRGLFALAILAGIACSVALLAGFSARYLDTASAMARGTYCFPIYPNYANLTLLLAALYAVPLVACAILRQPGHSAAPLAAAIGSAAVLLLPAALGRCDPGHVALNGLILFLLLFPALGQIKRSYLIGWAVVFGVCFVALGQMTYWNYYARYWSSAIRYYNYHIQHPEEFETWTREWEKAAAGSPNYRQLNWHKVSPFPEFGHALADSKDRIAAPLGADLPLDRFLKIRPGFVPPYYSMPFPGLLFAPQDVARQVAETKARADYVLVPDIYLAVVTQEMKHPPDGTEMQDMLSGLLMYPVQRKFRNEPYIPEVRVAASLLPGSQTVRNDGTYTLIKLAK